jgi:hypothetical protein
MHKIAQIAYEFGGARQSQRASVIALLSVEKDFATNMTAETKAFLAQGLQLRYTEYHPELEQSYIKEGDAYVPVTSAQFKAHKGDKVFVTANAVMAESSAKFGRMKADNPALYELYKAPRRAIGQYISNVTRDMQSLAKKILKEQSGETKPRAPNKDFKEKVANHFEKMRTELISSKSKGDETANEVLFRKAVVAFNTVWSHG